MGEKQKKKVGRPNNPVAKEIRSPYQPIKTIFHNLETGEKNLKRGGKDIFYDLSLVHAEDEFIALINKYEEQIILLRRQSLVDGRKKKEFRKDSLWKNGIMDEFQSIVLAWKHHIPKAKNEHRDRALMLSIFAFEMGIYSSFLFHDYPDAKEGANRRIKREKSAQKNRVPSHKKRRVIEDFLKEREANALKNKTAIYNHLANKYSLSEKSIRNILKEGNIN